MPAGKPRVTTQRQICLEEKSSAAPKGELKIADIVYRSNLVKHTYIKLNSLCDLSHIFDQNYVMLEVQGVSLDLDRDRFYTKG